MADYATDGADELGRHATDRGPGRHAMDDDPEPGAMDDELERVAVIGMACRVPGAADVAEFWSNLVNGVESIEIGADRPGMPRGYVPATGRLDGLEYFDADLFGMTPREAEQADPQHRLFLEQCWAALEDAACDPSRYAGRIGVWGGCSFNTYLVLNLLPGLTGRGMPVEYPASLLHGNDKDYLTSRVAYKLGLTGPAVTVQTACSTSLVAVAQACQALLDYQCDAALAGGVSVKLPQDLGYVHEHGGIQSPDGHCRAFDADAAGTVFTNGVGVVMLKRLSDALADGDVIHAVILGSAVNSDGARKVGYAAPSVDGQAEAVAAAYRAAEISPSTIGYVEAHGTGTAVGDPIELAALDKVFGAAGAAPGSVAIGSVKTNIGHLNAAAGVIGLMKAILAVRHGRLPASLNYRRPNPRTRRDSPFAVNAALRPWPDGEGPRRAGVSSFGVGGTNAHVVIEQPPPRPLPAAARHHHVLTLSARTPEALDQARTALAATLTELAPGSPSAAREATAAREVPSVGEGVELAAVASTLQRGRRAFAYRVAVACADPAEGAAALRGATGRAAMDRPSPVLLFPGQGSQYRGMAAGLMDSEPEFAERLRACARVLDPLIGRDLIELLTEPGPDPLVATELAQPALFAVEYALASWLESIGVRPVAMLGHSIGEWVAACVAGVFTLPDALALVAARGRLVGALPGGSMLAVELTEEQARAYESAGLAVAAVNAPARCVLSGPAEAVERVRAELAERGVAARPLATSHAFHSAALDPMMEPFAELVAAVPRQAPRVPFVSNVTGTWIGSAQATDPRYWARQARHAVRFADGIAAVLAVQRPVLLEAGPGRALGRLAAQTAGPGVPAIGTLPGAGGKGTAPAALAGAVAALWEHGVDVDWAAYHGGAPRLAAQLPGYPFQRRRHWVDAPDALPASDTLPAPASRPTTAGVPGSGGGTRPDEAAVPGADPTSEGGREAGPAHGATAGRDRDGGDEAAAGHVIGQVIELWRDLLGCDDLDVTDDLFMLGGDSLVATRLISRADRLFDVEVPLDEFLDEPTVSRMAALITGKV
ncbi:acyltransferase domain-containing protein [Nonomuraea phyllanthi]|uniref:type I polyketide synthase n=1 Tax=Nonomuraea phyllanthi TaxID=2219224 RepID=UPI001293AA00|nr:type I polyketide synthase [Nonomuraea phyllanthi]QFY07532.1 acyltransferase domain-containing protein [Nonomuraea phyllanthi]